MQFYYSCSWRSWPNDGNGTNFVEVPRSTSATGPQPFSFNAIAYDADGNLTDTDNVQWELIFDFNATEGNQSKIASLSNQEGNNTFLTLHSTLQSGKVKDFKIVSTGSGYSNNSIIRLTAEGHDFEGRILVNAAGGIIDVNITNAGIGYDDTTEIIFEDTNGSGAHLQPVLSPGVGILKATLNGMEGRVQFLSSPRNKLNNKEKWLDLYLF